MQSQPWAVYMNNKKKKLSILIPVFNERYLAKPLLQKVVSAPLPENLDREIIVVDDCSTDGTWKILADFCDNNSDIKLLRQEKNYGKGRAISRAIQEATGDFAIFQDADLEYDPADYKQLLEPILTGRADVVYGSRFVTGQARRVLFFHHSIGNKFLTALSNTFTGLNLTDMETCYKAFRLPILKSIPIRSNRFGIEPEITAKIAKRNLRVYEVPISYHGRTYREGKKITWKDGLAAIFVIFKYWIIDDIYAEKEANILYSLSRTHRYNQWIVNSIAPYLGDRILEVGSGIGTISSFLCPRDLVIFTDANHQYIQRLQNQFSDQPNVKILHMDISSNTKNSLIEEELDTIVCLNVLEYTSNDKFALESSYKIIKNKGRLLLLVPHFTFFPSTVNTIRPNQHIYSKANLIKILRETGFKIIEIKYFNRIGAVWWFINCKLLKKSQFSRVHLKFFDMFVWLWKILDKILPWPGQSIIAVAEKSD